MKQILVVSWKPEARSLKLLAIVIILSSSFLALSSFSETSEDSEPSEL